MAVRVYTYTHKGRRATQTSSARGPRDIYTFVIGKLACEFRERGRAHIYTCLRLRALVVLIEIYDDFRAARDQNAAVLMIGQRAALSLSRRAIVESAGRRALHIHISN